MIPLRKGAPCRPGPSILVESLCRVRTRPPLGNDKTCGTENFLPHPSQYVKRFKGTITYRKRILSWNSSHENYVPLRRWGIAVSHDPFFFACWGRFSPALSARSFCLKSNAFSAISLCFYLSAIDLRMQPLCATYLRSVPPKSDPTKYLLAALEVLYARSANIQGSGILRPPHFMLWPWISLRSKLTSSPPKRAGKKASIRESYIGPIREPTPGTDLCIYSHSS